MPTAAALEFDNITKEYRSFFRNQSVKALNEFSLRVESGEIFGFLGPNGAGKTTAIHIALGFTFPSNGRGAMLGHPFGHAPTRRRVGFLPENVAVYHRPATQLVRFYGALNGVPKPGLPKATGSHLKGSNSPAVPIRMLEKFFVGWCHALDLAKRL